MPNCVRVCPCWRVGVSTWSLSFPSVFSGNQLEVLANDVLTDDVVFPDYTDTDGQWNVAKSNGNPIDLTVWTRCVCWGPYVKSAVLCCCYCVLWRVLHVAVGVSNVVSYGMYMCMGCWLTGVGHVIVCIR